MIKIIFTLVLTVVLSPIVTAAMQPMTDEELGIQTGQAFFQIDRDTSGSVDFTKFTFGMDIDISMNSDLVELGRYERGGEATGSSDIRINDFALGSINSDGTLNPFQITDPFFELAFEDVNGKEELIGVRLGFGSAFGKLSGNIEYLTGNIQVALYGLGRDIAPNMNCGFFDLICSGAKALVGGAWANDQFSADAILIDTSGNPDPIRASYIGMKNGDSLSMPGSSQFTNFLVSLLTSQGCSLQSTQTCFPLSNYRTLDVGNKDTGEAASGMFISFQSKSVSWIDNGVGTTTVSGAFMNIPNGGIRTSFEEAFNGIDRIRTKFLDPYYD